MIEKMKNVAVLGASGYTGVEAVRLILAHPRLNLVGLSAHSQAGQPYGEIYPQFAHVDLPDVVKWDEIDYADIDVVFACLPHGASQETIAIIADKVETIIDLSADFRLRDPEIYAQTYDRPHAYPDMLDHAVYGLSEYAREMLPGAKLVACPGCYPTCSLLSLLPGIEADMIMPEPIIIDAKSGVTGAGRKTAQTLLYSELTDGAHAYGVGAHRHAPEIDQMLARISGRAAHVSFTPHLLPMNRGMITTSYVHMTEGVSIDKLRATYVERYSDSPFVHVEAVGVSPQTRHVRASNHARIGIFADRIPGRAIIIAVIDNLTKGSSGQAVQNYNLTQGWDEVLGLDNSAVFP